MPQPPKPLRPDRSARDWSGAELRHWRTLRGISQDQLGAIVHVSGDLIAKIEKATRSCPPDLAESLDAVLDTGGVLSRHLVLVEAEADRRTADADNRHADADNSASALRRPDGSTILASSDQAIPKEIDVLTEFGLRGPSTGAAVGEEVRIPCRTADGRIAFVTMPRRALLRGGLTGAAFLATAVPPAGPASATERTRASGAFLPDVHPVHHLQQLRQALVECDNILGPGNVIATVRQHLQLIQELRLSAAGADRYALLRVQAEYAEFCGWLYQDAGEHQAAQYWTDRALDWSHAAADQELTAYVMARKAQLAGDMKDAVEAVDLADAVLRCAPPGSLLRAMAAIYGAHGHALRGDAIACQRSYDEAIDVVSSVREESPRRRGSWLDVSYIQVHQSHSLSLLGHHRAAVVGFEQAIRTLPPTYRRDRGVYLTRAAVAHARAGDPEQATQIAAQALPLAAETGSGRILAEMASLDEDLRHWSTVPEVIAFRQALDGIVAHEV